MDLSLSLNAKEVLFHLNYMGYRNITQEQLKFFMIGKFSVCLRFSKNILFFFLF